MSKYDAYTEEAQKLKGSTLRWWKPEAADVLTGKVVFIGDNERSAYGAEKIIKIEDGDGQVWGRRINAVMGRELEEQGVTVGDVISIKFLGPKESKSGNTFHDFKVMVHERTDIPF